MVKRSLRDATYKRRERDGHLPMVTNHRTEINGQELKYRKIAVKHQESLSYCQIGQTLENVTKSLHTCTSSKNDLIEPCAAF